MKNLFYFFIAGTQLLFVSCSSSNDEVEPENKFEDAEYVKSQMIGKWNYWGHNSPGNGWVYSGDIYKWNFQFKSDNTYTNKNLSNQIQTGTYTVIPATKTDNPILFLNYKENNTNYTRKIILRKLENNTATIYESSFEERYVKE